MKGKAAQTQAPVKQMRANVSLTAIAKTVLCVLEIAATPYLLLLLLNNQVIHTVFPHIVAAAIILFWKLESGKYSREETNQVFLEVHTYS